MEMARRTFDDHSLSHIAFHRDYSVPVHEIGHNLALQHSGEGGQSGELIMRRNGVLFLVLFLNSVRCYFSTIRVWRPVW